MLNIYFDAERMKYPNTGIYEYCAQLSRSLEPQLGRDEALSCYVPDELTFDWQESTGRYSYASWHRFFMPRQRDASLWHSTYQLTRYLPQWKLPTILTVHDLNFLYEPRSDSSRKRKQQRLQRNVNKSSHLVAISKYVAKDIDQHLNLRGQSVHVIYNGVDVQYDPYFDSPRYRPERSFCFTIGPTIPKKNFHVLPCLLRNNDLELVIAGSSRNAYADKILEEAKFHGVEDRVKILGAVTHEEKFWYFRKCAAFLFPSLAEGFGIPVIEAMYFGKRVFLSEHTSLPEIGGAYASYFDSFNPDSMSATFDRRMSAELSDEETSAIREHSRSFSWASSARQYLDLYRSVVTT